MLASLGRFLELQLGRRSPLDMKLERDPSTLPVEIERPAVVGHPDGGTSHSHPRQGTFVPLAGVGDDGRLGREPLSSFGSGERGDRQQGQRGERFHGSDLSEYGLRAAHGAARARLECGVNERIKEAKNPPSKPLRRADRAPEGRQPLDAARSIRENPAHA